MLNFAQGVFAAASRTKAVAALHKFALKDRFEHAFERRLHHPVFHRRDAQWPLATACFGNVYPPHRLRYIAASAYRLTQFSQILRRIGCKYFYAHAIYALGTSIGLHSLPSRF
jgi:hypothetical protein